MLLLCVQIISDRINICPSRFLLDSLHIYCYLYIYININFFFTVSLLCWYALSSVCFRQLNSMQLLLRGHYFGWYVLTWLMHVCYCCISSGDQNLHIKSNVFYGLLAIKFCFFPQWVPETPKGHNSTKLHFYHIYGLYWGCLYCVQRTRLF